MWGVCMECVRLDRIFWGLDWVCGKVLYRLRWGWEVWELEMEKGLPSTGAVVRLEGHRSACRCPGNIKVWCRQVVAGGRHSLSISQRVIGAQLCNGPVVGCLDGTQQLGTCTKVGQKVQEGCQGKAEWGRGSSSETNGSSRARGFLATTAFPKQGACSLIGGTESTSCVPRVQAHAHNRGKVDEQGGHG